MNKLLGFPTEYIANMGKKAISEQKLRLEKKKTSNILDDLEELEVEAENPVKKGTSRIITVSAVVPVFFTITINQRGC